MHTTSSTFGAAAPRAPARLVTDAPTRMFHWLFAATFAGAWLTAESEHWRALHVTLGYTFGGLLAFRVLYGLFGPRQAALSLPWRKLAGARVFLASLRGARSPAAVNWRQGQHLAMALAICAILALALPLVLSGWLTWQEWGGEVFEELHEGAAHALLAAVLLHAGLIGALSLLRRQNLARPMLTGRLPGPGASPVRHPRTGLAAALLLAVLAFGALQWQASPQGLLPSATAPGHHHDDDEDGS